MYTNVFLNKEKQKIISGDIFHARPHHQEALPRTLTEIASLEIRDHSGRKN